MDFKKHFLLSVIFVFFVLLLFSIVNASLIAMQAEEERVLSFIQPVLSPAKTFKEIEENVQAQYPKYFSGNDKLDRKAIEDYRQSWASFTGKNKDVFSVRHNPALLSVLEQFEKNLAAYEEQFPLHRVTMNRFIHEIQFYKETENITPSWFDKLFFRILCATSTISPQERDFIAHLTEPYPTLFFALQENQAWKSHESAMESMDRCKHKVFGLPTYKHFILPPDTIQEIKERVDKALFPQITYTIWGKGKLGVAFIVKEMLNDIFLVGAPLKKLNVHGIPSSPYGFAVHDLFHKSVDHRHFTFIQHIIDQAERYVQNGGSVQKFLSLYLPSAFAKYRGIMEGLKEIYEQLICTFDQFDSRKAMLGFFWILHEEPSFPSTLYTVRNFDDILKILAEDDEGYVPPKIIYENLFSPHSSTKMPGEVITAGVDLKDHFDTSPVDGSTPWASEAIIEWVLHNKRVREARKYELLGYSGAADEFIKREDIVSQIIKRSPRYIDVTFVMRQGEELTYSFQTLFYNMTATHDALKILELIDIKTDLPDLSSAANPRAVAQAFIKKGENDIDGLIIHFRKVASFFANKDIPGKGSLVERYAQLYDTSNRSLLFEEFQ